MATFNKYDQYAVDLAAGVHILTTAGSQLMVCLSNTAPTPGTDAVLVDVTQISYANITETVPADTQNVGSETPAGTWDVTGTDITLNATGAVATFQYVILYNDTPTSPADPLIGWWQTASPVTLANGESFTIDIGTSIFTVA
ncbi:MAG: hypothetical protein KAS32_23140 [Candidatus Peribacteraceae bacterium]|nr:hypothetical protein [Candidatus Peribacteraceae bacterium]